VSVVAETLILSGAEIARLLRPADCREAVEHAFLRLGQGLAPPPRSIGFEAPDGSFHVKAARFDEQALRFVAKINGNFPGNPAANGLPTIQGVVVLSDASDGRVLAVMDSAALTAVRTAAATAVAIRHLAPRCARIATIVGCGAQGAAHVDALLELCLFHEIRLVDADPARARALASRVDAPATLRASDDRAAAVRDAHVVVTCTTGAAYVLFDGDIEAGTLIAGVGADHPLKRELHPSLMRRARVVVDDLGQCASGGDLHHAIVAGVMSTSDVRADLGTVVAGGRAGREHDDEIVVFDSTGIAIEDAAAASLVYELAVQEGAGERARFQSGRGEGRATRGGAP